MNPYISAPKNLLYFSLLVLLFIYFKLGVCETIFMIRVTWLWVQWHSDQAAPIARRCLAVSSALARCVLRTHSLRLSAMT